MMLFLRSGIFMLWFAALSVVMAIVFLPVLLLPRAAASWLGRRWSRLTLWGLKVFANLGCEIRGEKPKGALIAAKHMSMWDTLTLYMLLENPAMILKRSLYAIPFFGWYLWKAGSIGIDRSGGASALRRMVRAAKNALAQQRCVVIFPEGSRKKAGVAPDYRPGVAGLYELLGVPCVPVALNSGLFWNGFWKKPGTVTLEFLDPVPVGLERHAFMEVLQNRIETATERLIARESERRSGLEH